MQGALLHGGHEAAVVYTGAQAYEYLEANPQIEAAIVDLILPEMDGFQLIRRMRETDTMRYIPIIICTTLREMEAVERGARLGCRHYVLKPVQGDELVRRVNDAIEKSVTLLEPKRRTIERLSLDEQSYNDVVRTFGKLLDEKTGQTHSFLEGTLSTDVTLDYKDLAEGAQLLGALKILSALEPFGVAGGPRPHTKPTPDDYNALLREMHAVERLLRPARRNNVIV